MLGFVHATHTGGSAVEAAVANCPQVVGRGLWNTERAYERQNVTAFMVLRDPVERFASQFHAWRAATATEPVRRAKVHRREFVRLYPNVSSFVQSGMEDSAAFHTITAHAMGAPTRQHFFAQTAWLNGRKRDTWLVCYDRALLATRVQRLLTRLGVPCAVGKTMPAAAPSAPAVLSAAERQWVLDRYRDDAALWRECVRSPSSVLRLSASRASTSASRASTSDSTRAPVVRSMG